MSDVETTCPHSNADKSYFAYECGMCASCIEEEADALRAELLTPDAGGETR